jgi:ABC-type phosphate transport system substrate-binding protein
MILLVFTVACFSSDFAIVVNSENQTDNLALEEVKKIFLGKKINWDTGGKIKIAALKEGDLHKEFLQEILKMNPVQFSLVWKKKLFTGKNTQLRLFKDDLEIREFVKSEVNAIGYIAVEHIDDSVKKVSVVD